MKKFAMGLAVMAILAGNGAYAQTTTNKPKPQMGSGAQSATYLSYDGFAWGIGLFALAVLGTVVGVTAAAASSNQGGFNH